MATTTPRTSTTRSRAVATKAKAPADRQPKTEKPKVEAVDGGKRVTLHGITVTVLDEALDDFELLEDLASAQSGSLIKIPSMLRRLVGDEYNLALDAIRDDNGRVKMQAGADFVNELFGALNPNS